MASVHSMPVSSATASASRACLAFAVNDFSTNTFLPAFIHRIACSACRLCGVAIYTKSTSGSATNSSYEP